METIGDGYQAICGHDNNTPDHATKPKPSLSLRPVRSKSSKTRAMAPHLLVRGLHTLEFFLVF